MATAPPRLVYDDDCGFCTWCAAVAARHAGVEPVGFRDLSPDQRARLPEGYESCAHLLTDDAVHSCGAAVERTLARTHVAVRLLLDGLGRLDGYPALRERLYRWAADRRDWWGRVASADRI